MCPICFRLFKDKNIWRFFHRCGKVVCIGSILSSFQYQFIVLVSAHSCNRSFMHLEAKLIIL